MVRGAPDSVMALGGKVYAARRPVRQATRHQTRAGFGEGSPVDVVEDVVVDAPLSWSMRFGRGVDVRLRSLRRRSAGRCREAVL